MPTPGDLHIDQIMTNFAISYRNMEFVGDRLFPTVPVTKKSNKFAILDPKKDQQRIVNTIRAPRTRAKSVDWANDTATYTAEEYAVNAPVDDSERDNADQPFEPDSAATAAALDAILLDREARIATKATTAASFAAAHKTTLAGVNQWSDVTSNPRGDIDTAVNAIRQDVGKLPNRALMGFAVFQKVALVTKVLSAIQYVMQGVTTVQTLTTYLGLGEIVVAPSVKNTANEGQVATMADVWGKFCVIAYVDDSAGLWGMTFGKTFQWLQLQVRRWRDEGARTDFFEPMASWDEKLVAVDAGYLVSAAIA